MRLAFLTRASTVALLSIMSVSGVVLFKQQAELNRIHDSKKEIFDLKETISDEIFAPVNRYIASGDAFNLQNAETSAHNLLIHLTKASGLPTDSMHTHDGASAAEPSQDLDHYTEHDEHRFDDFSEYEGHPQYELYLALHDFELFLHSKARSAGKLGGDIKALLHQNNSDTIDEIEYLDDYGIEAYGHNQLDARTYRNVADRMLQLVHERSSALHHEGDLMVSEAQRVTDAINQLISVTDSLPRIGLYEDIDNEEDEHFAELMGIEIEDESVDVQEDRADEIISNLKYLNGRYMTEVDRTIQLQQAKKEQLAQLDQFFVRINDVMRVYETESTNSFAQELQYQKVSLITLFCLLVIILLFTNGLQARLGFNISKITPKLKKYAEGDFRKPLKLPAFTEDVISLRDSTNTLRSNFVDVIHSLRHKSDILMNSVDNSEKSNNYVLQAIDMQMNQTEEISNATEQMTASFKEVAQSASDAADLATNVEDVFVEGYHVIKQTVDDVTSLSNNVVETSEQIQILEERAGKVAEALVMIQGISEQVNLLALNAAIEAARAGHHGRGFAVVADEVRNLAKKTSESTVYISDIVNHIQTHSVLMVDTMKGYIDSAKDSAARGETSAETLNTMLQQVKVISDKSVSIATTTEQQATVATNIAANISQINSFCASIKSQQKQASQDSATLRSESLGLIESVAHFQVEERTGTDDSLHSTAQTTAHTTVQKPAPSNSIGDDGDVELF